MAIILNSKEGTLRICIEVETEEGPVIIPVCVDLTRQQVERIKTHFERYLSGQPVCTGIAYPPVEVDGL